MLCIGAYVRARDLPVNDQVLVHHTLCHILLSDHRVGSRGSVAGLSLMMHNDYDRVDKNIPVHTVGKCQI